MKFPMEIISSQSYLQKIHSSEEEKKSSMNKVFHADFHTRRCLSIAGHIDFEVHIANGNNTQNFARRGGEVSANW